MPSLAASNVLPAITPPRQALHALNESYVGVAVAHDAHVIHSDIKPGNILCSDDFSIIKFSLSYAINASLSAVCARGTMLYMAPELGVVTIESLTLPAADGALCPRPPASF
jgi:serine/threonine protein kinase